MTTVRVATPEEPIRELLQRAAESCLCETDRFCRSGAAKRHPLALDKHERVVESLTSTFWQASRRLLPVETAPDAAAPLLWSIQEIVEWISHARRREILADDQCTALLTWRPRRVRDLADDDALISLVEERLILLREEMRDYDVDLVPAGACPEVRDD